MDWHLDCHQKWTVSQETATGERKRADKKDPRNMKDTPDKRDSRNTKDNPRSVSRYPQVPFKRPGAKKQRR